MYERATFLRHYVMIGRCLLVCLTLTSCQQILGIESISENSDASVYDAWSADSRQTSLDATPVDATNETEQDADMRVHPSLELVFPPINGTLTDAATVVVRGTCSAASGLDEVRIGDIVAQGNLADWQLTIPLDVGENTLAVECTDRDDLTEIESLTITRVEELSNVARGQGSEFRAPMENVLHWYDGKLFVAEQYYSEVILAPKIIIINPITGDRETLGPALTSSQAAVFPHPYQENKILSVSHTQTSGNDFTRELLTDRYRTIDYRYGPTFSTVLDAMPSSSGVLYLTRNEGLINLQLSDGGHIEQSAPFPVANGVMSTGPFNSPLIAADQQLFTLTDTGILPIADLQNILSTKDMIYDGQRAMIATGKRILVIDTDGPNAGTVTATPDIANIAGIAFSEINADLVYATASQGNTGLLLLVDTVTGSSVIIAKSPTVL